MKDYLLKHGEKYIECKLNDLELTYTFSDEPKYHYIRKLRNSNSYENLKSELNRIYEFYDREGLGYAMVCEFLNTTDCIDQYFTEGSTHVYTDLRDEKEIEEYLDEAFDKVWLMRNCLIRNKIPKNEVGRDCMNRIFNNYDDIPKDGYTDWECGYRNGIRGLSVGCSDRIRTFWIPKNI